MTLLAAEAGERIGLNKSDDGGKYDGSDELADGVSKTSALRAY